MYEATRRRAPNSTKIAGASTAVLLTALMGYALMSGLAQDIGDRILPETVMRVVDPKPEAPDPVERPDLDTTVAVDAPKPLAPDLPVFVLDESPMIAGSPVSSGGDGLGAGLGTGGGGGKPAPVRSRPKLISTDLPLYPRGSVDKNETGLTGLSVCLSERGRVTSANVASSSGFPRLDDAALTWVKRARFTPATVDGKAEAMCGHRIEYEWKLNKLCGDSPEKLKPCRR